MAKKSPLLSQIGFVSFCIGFALGILLILVSAWADMEASVYGFLRYTKQPLPSLSCPALMTSQDREQISLRVHNPLDKVINQSVLAQFSSALTIDTYREEVELQPGETKRLSWEVGKENIDLGNFIFANVFTFPVSTIPMKETICGIFVLDLPIGGGKVIFYIALVLVILGVGLGLTLWQRNSDLSDPAVVSQIGRMRFLTVIMGIGLLTSLFSMWIVGMLSLVVTVVTLSVFLVPRKN